MANREDGKFWSTVYELHYTYQDMTLKLCFPVETSMALTLIKLATGSLQAKLVP